MHPDKEPYAAMLDEFEKGMDEATIDRIFNGLKEALIPFVREILSKPEPDDTKFRGDFDVNKQKAPPTGNPAKADMISSCSP